MVLTENTVRHLISLDRSFRSELRLTLDAPSWTEHILTSTGLNPLSLPLMVIA